MTTMKKRLILPLALALATVMLSCKKEECEPLPPVTVIDTVLVHTIIGQDTVELSAKYTVVTYGDPLVEITRNGNAVEPDSGMATPCRTFTVFAAAGDQMDFRLTLSQLQSANIYEESYPNGDAMPQFFEIAGFAGDTLVERVCPL